MIANRKSRKDIILVFMLISMVPVFIIGYVFRDTFITWLIVMVTWLDFVVYNFSRSRVIKLSFLFTFFSFLLGEIFINQFGETAFHAMNDSSILHVHLCIYISLWFFQVGAVVGKYKYTTHCINKYKIGTNWDIQNIRSTCKFLYMIFATCSLALALERFIMIKALGSYTASFVNYTSSLPSIISKMSSMADMIFFVYLATLPNPKKSKIVFGYKLLISIIILLYGTRSNIVMTVLIIAIYCILYENMMGQEYSIIPKYIYYSLIIVIPLVLILFDFLMAIRDGREYTSKGVLDSLRHIITSMGGSVNVITYGYENADQIPNKIYSFGGVIDFFTQNIFARTLLGIQQYGGNTAALALNGHSFSNTLTYIVKKASFLAGYGMGSSYIAEAYHDFGYIGVAGFNVVYGIILEKCNHLLKNNIIGNTIILMATYYILFAPRAYADGFLSCFVNFSFILAIMIIIVSSKIRKNLVDKK